MYFVTLKASNGQLTRFEMTPLRIRRFRLNRAPRDEARWLTDVLTTQGRPLGTRVEPKENGVLVLRWT